VAQKETVEEGGDRMTIIKITHSDGEIHISRQTAVDVTLRMDTTLQDKLTEASKDGIDLFEEIDSIIKNGSTMIHSLIREHVTSVLGGENL
jgi:hypothetical protein